MHYFCHSRVFLVCRLADTCCKAKQLHMLLKKKRRVDYARPSPFKRDWSEMIHCLLEGTMTTSRLFLSTTKLCASVSVCNHHSCSKTLISRTTRGLGADSSCSRALKAISIANEDTTPTASLCTLDPPFRRQSHSSCFF